MQEMRRALSFAKRHEAYHQGKATATIYSNEVGALILGLFVGLVYRGCLYS